MGARTSPNTIRIVDSSAQGASIEICWLDNMRLLTDEGINRKDRRLRSGRIATMMMVIDESLCRRDVDIHRSICGMQ